MRFLVLAIACFCVATSSVAICVWMLFEHNWLYAGLDATQAVFQVFLGIWSLDQRNK